MLLPHFHCACAEDVRGPGQEVQRASHHNYRWGSSVGSGEGIFTAHSACDQLGNVPLLLLPREHPWTWPVLRGPAVGPGLCPWDSAFMPPAHPASSSPPGEVPPSTTPRHLAMSQGQGHGRDQQKPLPCGVPAPLQRHNGKGRREVSWWKALRTEWEDQDMRGRDGWRQHQLHNRDSSPKAQGAQGGDSEGSCGERQERVGGLVSN